MIFKIDGDGKRIATPWRGDLFTRVVAEARRENNKSAFLGQPPRWVGVYQDTTGRIAAIGISRESFKKILAT